VVVAPDQGPRAGFATGAAPAGFASGFDGSSSTDPDGVVARYDWSFGDGKGAANAGPSPTHVYAKASSYTATLTVTDEDGCSTVFKFTGQTAFCNSGVAARKTRTVTVPAGPAAPAFQGGLTGPLSTPPLPSPRSLSLKARRKRDRRRPFAFGLSGKLGRPSGVSKADGCRGRVTITLKRGKRRLARKSAKLRSNCTYKRSVRLRGRRLRGKITATARFPGNSALKSRRSPKLRLRAG
jgi:hypothetical protein